MTCPVISTDVGIIYSKLLFIGTSIYFFINAILHS